MDTIFVTEKLILHAEKEQLLGISFLDKLSSDCCKLHTQTFPEPVPIKNLKSAIDLYMEDDEKEINDKNMEVARGLVVRELSYCILAGPLSFAHLMVVRILRFRFQNAEKAAIKSFQFRPLSNST